LGPFGTGPALWRDLDVLFLVVRSLDADDAVGEIHICPAERHELSAAQTCIEGCSQYGSIALGKCGEKSFCLLW
jgi:hypothetical protein